MPSKHDADAWDREAAYHYVRRMVINHQAKERPTDAPVAERLTVRRRCCDTGPLSVERYETALAALDEQAAIALGNEYVGRFESREMGTDAIEWVAGRDEVDKAFIGAVNALEFEEGSGDE